MRTAEEVTGALTERAVALTESEVERAVEKVGGRARRGLVVVVVVVGGSPCARQLQRS